MQWCVFEGKVSGSGYLQEYEFMSKRHTEGLLTPLLNGPWFYPRPVAKCPYAKHWSLMPIHGEFFCQLVKGCPLINYACSYFKHSSSGLCGPVQSQWFPVRSVQQSLTIRRVMWWSVAQRIKTPHITERTDDPRGSRFLLQEVLLWCGNLTLLQL